MPTATSSTRTAPHAVPRQRTARRTSRRSTEAGVGDAVQAYLSGIGRHDLLTAAEEVELAKRIEAGLYAETLLAAGSYQNGPISPQLGRELRHIVRDGATAKDRLVAANLRLVVSVAKRYTHFSSPLSLLDLIQEGNLGLIRAVEKFDYAKGFKFSTYATWWIRQAISRALADQSRVIRVPVHVVEQISRISKARRELAMTLGHEPSIDELADDVELTPSRVRELLDLDREPLSLAQPIGGEDGTALGDFIADTVAGPDTLATGISIDPAHVALSEAIAEVLAGLTEREQQVLRLRFGLCDGRQRTLEEVGAECGLSRERIRQLEKASLRKLTTAAAHLSGGSRRLVTSA